MRTSKIELQCMHKDCGAWFRPPIYLADDVTIDTITISMAVTCPVCTRKTMMTKERLRARYGGEQGGFVGDPTKR